MTPCMPCKYSSQLSYTPIHLERFVIDFDSLPKPPEAYDKVKMGCKYAANLSFLQTGLQYYRTLNFCPGRMMLFLLIPLSLHSLATVVPYLRLMPYKLSPLRTLWYLPEVDVFFAV